MSPLTKVFVALLVITSLLLAAGTVVFVNKIPLLKPTLDQANKDLTTAREALRAEHDRLMAAQADTSKVTAAAENQRKADFAVIEQMNNKITDLQTQVAQLVADKTARDQQIANLTRDLSWQETTAGDLQKNVDTLRKTNETLVIQQNEASQRISELTAIDEAADAKLKYTSEQLVMVQEENERLKAALLKNGIPLPTANAPEVYPLNPISGVVKDKRNIDGDTWVTINVGSVDGVKQGMELALVHKDTFLGFVNVQKVDNNESVCKFTGSKPGNADLIAPQDQVKTQLMSRY